MSDNGINIHGTSIGYGKTVVHFEIARLHTHTPVSIPIIIERAKAPGPTLLVTAGIHGDEVNGVEIVRQIIVNGYNRPKRGMVICIPVVNVFGFLNRDRKFPDGRDLNRSFPGSPKGSLASRFAHFIIHKIVPHVDYIIDYHTGGASRFNYSQVRYNPDDRECEELAKAFGTRFILRASTRDHSFRAMASSMGKKVLMFEGGKSMYLDRNVTRSGIDGFLRTTHHLKMNDHSQMIELMPKKREPIIINSSAWIRAKYSGMFRSDSASGSFVKKGTRVGSITDPFGDFERVVKAPWDGYIICINHSPIVNQGDGLIHISKETVANV